MPGAPRFGHKLDDAAVFKHEIMTGDLRGGIAEPIQRALGRGHAGIVQDDAVGCGIKPAFAMVGEGATLATSGESGAKGVGGCCMAFPSTMRAENQEVALARYDA